MHLTCSRHSFNPPTTWGSRRCYFPQQKRQVRFRDVKHVAQRHTAVSVELPGRSLRPRDWPSQLLFGMLGLCTAGAAEPNSLSRERSGGRPHDDRGVCTGHVHGGGEEFHPGLPALTKAKQQARAAPRIHEIKTPHLSQGPRRGRVRGEGPGPWSEVSSLPTSCPPCGSGRAT